MVPHRWSLADHVALKLLQVLDPLIVTAIVEPRASALLHAAAPVGTLREGEHAEKRGEKRGGLFASIFGAADAGGHKECLADLCVRLQLLLLSEGAASDEARQGCLDVPRQMHELLFCAAIWCQKPTQTEEARQTDEFAVYEAPSRAVQLQQLAACVGRVMNAWPSAPPSAENGDACAGARPTAPSHERCTSNEACMPHTHANQWQTTMMATVVLMRER